MVIKSLSRNEYKDVVVFVEVDSYVTLTRELCEWMSYFFLKTFS
jgi:hypothetical protein